MTLMPGFSLGALSGGPDFQGSAEVFSLAFFTGIPSMGRGFVGVVPGCYNVLRRIANEGLMG